MREMCRLLLVLLFAWSAFAQIDTKSETGRLISPRINKKCFPFEYREAAAAVLAKMKNDTDPCDDFYQFACGNFVESVQIPEGKVLMDSFILTPNIFTQQVEEIITKERGEIDLIHFKLPNKFFKSCMNTTLINSLVDEPVRQISNALGGWPVVVGNSWNSDNSWSWQDLAKKLRRLGFSTDYIMNFYVDIDVENNARNTIYINGPSFVFKSDFYNISEASYKNFMKNAAIRFGAKKCLALWELRKAFDFEKDLVHIFEAEKNGKFPSHILSINQLQERYPYVQWLDFINGLLPEDLTIDGNMRIILLTPNFFHKLGTLLARTEKRTIANYIMWKFHYFSMKFLSKRFRCIHQKFDSSVVGTPLQRDRVKACASMVSTSLPIAISSLYIREYFKEISKATVQKIFLSLQNAFSQTLAESQWLDDETREEARRKLQSIKAIIGFADEVFDIGKVEEYYRELEIDENKYFHSYLRIMTFELNNYFGLLRVPTNEMKWFRYVTLGRKWPCHNLARYEIDIPASFLQGQFFNARRPNYMNFGSIGFIAGHEITHAFCGEGCKKFASPTLLEAISERGKCFVEQYSSYTDKQTGLKVNGSQTLVENIADNSGVKHAYLAYKQWQAKYGEEPKLPGVLYTPQQMFWISFAQNFCGKFSLDAMEHIINTDTHSPHEFRVLGVLRNMKEFSRDFHCPDNSPMNPEQKCEVW